MSKGRATNELNWKGKKSRRGKRSLGLKVVKFEAFDPFAKQISSLFVSELPSSVTMSMEFQLPTPYNEGTYASPYYNLDSMKSINYGGQFKSSFTNSKSYFFLEVPTFIVGGSNRRRCHEMLKEEQIKKASRVEEYLRGIRLPQAKIEIKGSVEVHVKEEMSKEDFCDSMSDMSFEEKKSLDEESCFFDYILLYLRSNRFLFGDVMEQRDHSLFVNVSYQVNNLDRTYLLVVEDLFHAILVSISHDIDPWINCDSLGVANHHNFGFLENNSYGFDSSLFSLLGDHCVKIQEEELRLFLNAYAFYEIIVGALCTIFRACDLCLIDIHLSNCLFFHDSLWNQFLPRDAKLEQSSFDLKWFHYILDLISFVVDSLPSWTPIWGMIPSYFLDPFVGNFYVKKVEGYLCSLIRDLLNKSIRRNIERCSYMIPSFETFVIALKGISPFKNHFLNVEVST
ncbi:hypothetical protein M9H77_30142 [Catharanthus roseus]|uniref:Uncharacterized protein n=1 Tax=Catharanthus roseus TaxID=4058 RepID=A0ACB9ZY98_CATRO|nr:hypothetical protein M9H77_30142 [Catharanthus roseus]